MTGPPALHNTTTPAPHTPPPNMNKPSPVTDATKRAVVWRNLFWGRPISTTVDKDLRARGDEGYVIDWTLPWEREWCAGQEYKLAHGDDDLEPSPLGNRAAEKLVRELQGLEKVPPRTVAEHKEQHMEQAPEKTTDTGVSPTPRKKASSKKASSKKEPTID